MWGKVGQNIVTTIFLLFSNFALENSAEPYMGPKLETCNKQRLWMKQQKQVS